MILKPKTCRRDRKVLCGVVKNVGNCPFPTIEHCNDNNTTNWFGMVSHAFGTVTLKRYNYNLHKIHISVLVLNMCDNCKIIWSNPDIECPVCKPDESPKYICDDCERVFYHNKERCYKCEGTNIREMTKEDMEE